MVRHSHYKCFVLLFSGYNLDLALLVSLGVRTTTNVARASLILFQKKLIRRVVEFRATTKPRYLHEVSN
jgi:hypothetical protein